MRRRHQTGAIWKENGAWFGRWREDVLEDGRIVRKRKCQKLCDYSDRYRTKTDVRPLLDDILRPINEGRSDARATMQLGAFVENFYFPYCEQQKHMSTEEGYRQKWRSYLKALCSDLWLRDVRTHHVQQVLYQIARQHPNLSRATLQRCKTVLSAVFSFAKKQGYFDGVNPVIGTEIPASAHVSSETYAYSLAEINAILLVLSNPAHAIVATASYAGLSRSEIEGMTWENYTGTELRITRARVRGKFGEPKTAQRKNPVPVIPRLKLILDHYRLERGNPDSGVMFTNHEGQPTCLNNLSNRVIIPTLNRCARCHKSKAQHDAKAGHKFDRDKSLPEWQGYHACRRGLATNLHDLGVDDLTIQKILRHSNVKTTQACYIKTLPTQVSDAMEKLETVLASDWPVNAPDIPRKSLN
jgi:integrase